MPRLYLRRIWGNEDERMQYARFVLAGAMSLLVFAQRVSADYKDQIGFTLLHQEQGASTPTGANVKVMHCESGVASIQSDPISGEFAGKHFDFLPATPLNVDSHAAIVGSVFYGNSSIAPGISTISNYVSSFASLGLQAGTVLEVPQNYASNPTPGDANLDGLVNTVDFNIFSLHFGQS